MRSKLVGATSNGIKRNERRERKTAGLLAGLAYFDDVADEESPGGKTLLRIH
jgi:hypothetical protein